MGTPKGRAGDERARREQADEQLSFTEAAALHRSGHGEVLTDEERESIGAGASGLAVVTLLAGLFGLGPVGLVTGYVALHGRPTSSWIAVLGMTLSALHTVLLAVALVLAIAAG